MVKVVRVILGDFECERSNVGNDATQISNGRLKGKWVRISYQTGWMPQ